MSTRRRLPSEAQEKWLRDFEARLAGEAAAMWTPAFTHRSKNFGQKYFDDSNGYQETDL
jgi:hypothetical protein